jgi:hypothetical protein
MLYEYTTSTYGSQVLYYLQYRLVCGSSARLDTLPNGRHDDPKLYDTKLSILWKKVDPRTFVLVSADFQRVGIFSTHALVT